MKEKINTIILIFGFPILVFMLWTAIGFIFDEIIHGMLAGLIFGLFYLSRLLWAWFE